MDKLFADFELLKNECQKRSKVSKTRARKLLSAIGKQVVECRKILLEQQRSIPVKKKTQKDGLRQITADEALEVSKELDVNTSTDVVGNVNPVQKRKPRKGKV